MFERAVLLSHAGARPDVADSAWLAAGAMLIGKVTIGARSSVWFLAVLRGDRDRIDVGEESNLQDGVVVHADPGIPVSVGNRVTVGHRSMLHGCTLEDDVQVGMAAVVLNGAHIGKGSLVAAGAVLLEGTRVPPGSLIAGVPATVRRQLTEAEVLTLRSSNEAYVRLAGQYKDAHEHG